MGDSNGFSRRADTLKKSAQTSGRAINHYHIGSTPRLVSNGSLYTNNAERAVRRDGFVAEGESALSDIQTQKQNG